MSKQGTKRGAAPMSKQGTELPKRRRGAEMHPRLLVKRRKEELMEKLVAVWQEAADAFGNRRRDLHMEALMVEAEIEELDEQLKSRPWRDRD